MCSPITFPSMDLKFFSVLFFICLVFDGFSLLEDCSHVYTVLLYMKAEGLLLPMELITSMWGIAQFQSGMKRRRRNRIKIVIIFQKLGYCIFRCL